MLFVEMNEDFGVRRGSESMAAALKLLSDLAIVVDLAVENHRHIAGLVPDWLIPTCEIDDPQATHPDVDTQAGVVQAAFAIRPAMVNALEHGSQSCIGLPGAQ